MSPIVSGIWMLGTQIMVLFRKAEEVWQRQNQSAQEGWGLVSLWTALGVQRAEFMPGLPQDLSWSPSPTQAASSPADRTYPFSSRQI